MSEEVDAIIIGAGVIGASIAFELCKRGYRTLNIDKLPAAGYGPTSNSCSIVRAHYSSREGVAMAYEGFFYWQDWPQYVGDDDESGLAKYMQSGTVLLGQRHRSPREGAAPLPRPGRRARAVGQRRAAPAHPDLRHGRVLAAQAPERSALLGPARRRARRRDLHARLGLRQRSAAGHAQPAARQRGARRQVHVQGRGRRDPPGRRPRARRHADHGTRDRRAGRGQRRGTALVRDQPHGRRRGDDERQDPAVAPRGPPRPVAAGLRLRGRRVPHLRRRHRDLLPSGVGQPHPDRLRGSRLRPAHVGRRPGQLRPQRHRGPVGGAGLPARAADPEPADPARAQGRRRPLRRLRRLDPDLRPLRSRRLLHGDRNQRQPVQERAGRRAI